MKQRSALLAVLLTAFALIVLVGVFFLGIRHMGEAPGGGQVAARGTVQRLAGTEDGEGEGDTDELEAPEARVDEGRREAEEADAPAAAEPELRWIEGRIQLPAGTPANERVVALALSEPMSRAALQRAPGLLAGAWRGEAPSGRLLASAEVDESGRFRLGVPADVARVHLALTGRYLYSSASTVETADGESVLAATLGAWITGQIAPPHEASAEENGFEGVEVELGPDIGAGFNTARMQGSVVTHEVDAASDGTFEFRGVSSAMPHGVSVKHPHLAALLQLGVEAAPGEHLELELAMVRGATLLGTVVDEEGRGVADASVEVRFQGVLGNALDDLRKTTTDAAGSFTLANVSIDGRLELLARHDDYLDGRVKVDHEPKDGEQVTDLSVVLTTGGAIQGRIVFEDGSPAAGVSVAVFPDLSQIGGMNGMAIARSRGRNTVSAADGTFEVHGLSEIKFKVAAHLALEDGDRAGDWRATEAGVEPGGTPLLLTLEKRAEVTGRVVDQAGEPVTAFTVRGTLEGSGGMFGIGEDRREISVDDAPEGRFTLSGLDRGVWQIEASSPGYARSTPVPVEVPVADGGPPLVITLLPAASVAGVVLDTADLPMVNAQVTLQLGMAERIQASQTGGAPSAFTDTEGRFVLDSLDPGTLQLVASHEGFASSEVQSCVVGPGEAVDDLVLRLRTGGTLTGVVYGDGGEPAAGRMITVQVTPTYASQHVLQSDGYGEFRVEHLEPGTWQVVATPNVLAGEGMGDDEGMAELLANMKMDMAEIHDGEETHVVLGAPPEDPVALSVQVLAAGEPVKGSAVTFVPEGGKGMSSLKMGATNAEGRVQLTLDHPGPYLVTVQNRVGMGEQNSTEFLERIPEGVAEHTLVLELPHGRISGSVRGPDGHSLAGCRITLNSDGGIAFGSFLGGQYTETKTDEEGHYDVPYLRPGTYSVSAGGSPLGGLFGQDSEGGRVVRDGLELDEGEWLQSVDFRLSEPGEIRGRVVDASGAPAAEATIFARDEEGRLLERFSFITADASGAFVCPGLAPGRYTLSARHGMLASVESDPVRVEEGGTVQVTLELEPGTVVIVSVEEDAEVPSRPRIRVVDSEGRELSGMLSLAEIMENFGRGFSSEEQRIGPLPPGTYHVIATTKDGRTKTKPVTLKGQPERKLKLRLD